jgi:hypothetical protein
MLEFLTFALHGVESSASLCGRLIANTHWVRNCVDPRARLNAGIDSVANFSVNFMKYQY